MKRMITVIAVAMLCLPAIAGAANTYSGQILGGGDSVEGRVLLGPCERGKVGLGICWTDGLHGSQEAIQVAVVGLWDVVKDVNLPFVLPFATGVGTIKASGYIGAEIGALTPTHGEAQFDTTAAGLVGLVIGDPSMQIGVELAGALTDRFWSALADTPGSQVRFFIAYRFK